MSAPALGGARVLRAWVKPSVLAPPAPPFRAGSQLGERDEARRLGEALAGEAERKGWLHGSGNRGPVGWIPDPQCHWARGNRRPTPE